MNKELKPVRCGCGGEATIWHNFGGLVFVSCKSCEITTHGYDNHFQAIETWNRAMSGKDINVPNKFADDNNVGSKEPERWCNLCASYDKQSCYCNLYGIWVPSDFGCKSFGAYDDEENEDE